MSLLHIRHVDEESVLTPRRKAFVIEEQEKLLPVPRSPRPYNDPGVVSRCSAFAICLLALLILGALVLLFGQDRLTVQLHDEIERFSTHKSKWPVSPMQYSAECKDYYTTHPLMHEHVRPENESFGSIGGICSKSLTYQMSPHFGLTMQLNHILVLHSIAQQEGRAFFIEDSHFNRGTWTDHFAPISTPSCQRPQKLVACPRADHLIVNAHTFRYQLPHLEELSEDPHRNFVWRRKPLFNLARAAIDQGVLRLSKTNAALLDLARKELPVRQMISVHVRKGDRHPWSWQYVHDSGLPLNNFTTALHQTVHFLNDSFLSDNPLRHSQRVHVFLASDSQAVFKALPAMVDHDLWHWHSLARSRHEPLRRIASKFSQGYSQADFETSLPIERVLNTRGQIVEMALMADSAASICTISSNICRLNAVWQGWQRAIEDAKWINIDGREAYDWTLLEAP